MKIRRARLVLVVALVGLAWLGWGTNGKAETREMTPLELPVFGDLGMLRVGDAAPAFTLEDLDGRPVLFEGGPSSSVRFLVFWSIFCAPCKAEMPLVQRLYEEYRARGLEVLAISMDGEPMRKSIQGLVRQHSYTFPVAIDRLTADESFQAADPYGVPGTPTLYLVGRDGRIAFAEVGRTSREALQAAIERALSGT